MLNGGENFQCHACFVTTATGAEPTVKFQTRCAVTRTAPGHNAAAGVFYLTSTEDIGDDTFGDHVDYDVNANYSPAGTPTGVIVNVAKLAANLWQIQVFNAVDAATVLVLADLVGAVISITLKRVEPA